MISEHEWERRYESLLAENRKLSEENDRWHTAVARVESFFGGSVPAGDVQAYSEWRVTADHVDPEWRDKPPYEFIWSPLRNPQHGDAEDSARRFVEHFAKSGHMSNVKLMRRAVAIEAWQETWPRSDTPG